MPVLNPIEVLDSETKPVEAVAPPALTVSNSLVQFLSPLQLQGYVSHLVDEFGIRHVDDLAARVTCTEDVGAMLGAQASRQQQQELWRGLSKWKRSARKRERECVATKPDPKKAPISISDLADAQEERIEKLDREDTPRFAQTVGCSASQFMRQFAFQGYENDAPCISKNEPQHAQQTLQLRRRNQSGQKDGNGGGKEYGMQLFGVMGENHGGVFVGSMVCHDEDNNNDQAAVIVDGGAVGAAGEEADGAAVGAPLSLISSSGSSLWSAGVMGGSQPSQAKCLAREKFAIATLSVGTKELLSRDHFFTTEWNRDEASQNTVVETPIPCTPVEEVKPKDKATMDNTLETYYREYVELKARLQTAVDTALCEFNAGLQTLKEKVQVNVEGNPAMGNASRVEMRWHEQPPLRAILCPIEQMHRDKATSPPTPSRFVETLCINPSRNSTTRLSFADATILSPPSDTCGERTEVPTLSDSTTPGRGSHRHILTLTADIMGRTSQGTAPCEARPSIVDLSSTVLMSTVIEKVTVPHGFPLRCQRAESETLLVHSHSTDAEDDVEEDGVVLSVAPQALSLQPNEGASPGSASSFSLEQFGLQALSQAPAGASAMPKPVVRQTQATPVDSQAIDVDALSSACSDEDREEPILCGSNLDSICVPVAPKEGQPAPLGLTRCSSQESEEGLWLHQPPRRQPAVSRSSSASPPSSSQIPHTEDSTCIPATALDWTNASSIAADVRHLASRISFDEMVNSLGSSAPPPPPHGTTPRGLPPLPSRRMVGSAPMESDKDDSNAMPMEWEERLTPSGIASMKPDELRQWCLQLGLHLPQMDALGCIENDNDPLDDSLDAGDDNEEHSGDVSRLAGFTQDETSTGWWLPEQTMGGAAQGHTLSQTASDADDAEWRALRQTAAQEQMRESLCLVTARRIFAQEVVPFFFHRLPRFSGGAPYARPKISDVVMAHTALTRTELEERRRLARVAETDEVACCVMTSLAGTTVDEMDQSASGAKQNSTTSGGRGLSLYDRVLLMEPIDVQSATALVQADFPHVTRHRIETLLEESGIPLDLSRRGVNGASQNYSQRTASSCSPPPSSPVPRKAVETAASQQEERRRFFAQRGRLRQGGGR